MAAKYEVLWKNMYDYQTWNTKGIIHVKVNIWLTNLKYLSLLT